jgi:hypothetical protein
VLCFVYIPYLVLRKLNPVWRWVRIPPQLAWESYEATKRGTQCPREYLGHPVSGGYKYGTLALQVGGVSEETVKYGSEF